MIFTSSLPLITSDFNSFPEIRANFFAFLKALIRFNFNSLFSLPQDFFNTVLDCVIWSLRHELSTYADLGLSLLQEILTNVNKNADTLDSFYARFHMRILTEILDVMTDGFHKSGLKAQINIFFILVHVTTQNMVPSLLFRPLSPSLQTNLRTFPTAITSSIFWLNGCRLPSPMSAREPPMRKSPIGSKLSMRSCLRGKLRITLF